eukprot:COSAG03_NODE_6816_length_1002_cov_0.889258_1_plen_38_part_10
MCRYPGGIPPRPLTVFEWTIQAVISVPKRVKIVNDVVK